VDYSNLTASDLRDLKARGERGEETTITYLFNTGIAVRGLAKKIAFEVEKHGFEIVRQGNDGGLIMRKHFIAYRGNAWEAVIMARALNKYIEDLNREE
jgi:hypothetical protein